MLAFCIILILAKPTVVTMDIVRSTVNETGYVGENIYMKCFDPTDQLFQPTIAVLWMYLFHDDRTVNSTYITVARCEQGYWEYLSYRHQLVGNNDACENGLAYVRATKPGYFTYKCQERSEYSIDVRREVTFMITITCLDNSSISQCLAKYVPSSQNLIFDFICRNDYQRTCLNEKEWDNELFFQHNGDRIIPNITLANKVVARIGLENISSISQYYCINQNHASLCVVDTVSLYNPVAITPIVNRVIEGGNAIFECVLKDVHERGVRYEWRFSNHIEFSRISGTASSTLKISDVRFEDDGVIVSCAVEVNGTSLYSEALLKVRTEGGSSTTASYSAEVTTNLLPLATQPPNLAIATTSTQYIFLDSCKPLMMYFLIPVFGVLLIAAAMVSAVYYWTRDTHGLHFSDATQEVVQI